MEHFESEQTNKEHPEAEEWNGAFLKMQTEFMRHVVCTPGNNAQCNAWIDEYAQKLRNYADVNPEVVERWKANPEKTMTELKAFLFPEGEHSHTE